MTHSTFSSEDEFGFTRCEDFDAINYEKFMSSYLRVLFRRSRKWESYLSSSTLSKSSMLKRYVRKGIPSKHRSSIWMFISGADKIRILEPNCYVDLLSESSKASSILLEQIHIDVPRTFPNNIYFKSNHPQGLQQSLFNVLLAYSLLNPKIGYCQGMNYIVGLLLLVTKDEERSFWLLRVLLDQILPEYYIQDIPGLLTDVRTFSVLLKEKAPLVYSHVERLKIPWELISSKWFICLYSDVLPLETVLRIWDCLFYEGSKVLLRVALALIKLHERELLQPQEFSNAVKKFQNLSKSFLCLDAHNFMFNVYKMTDPLPSKHVTTIRNNVGKNVKNEIMSQAKRRYELKK